MSNDSLIQPVPVPKKETGGLFGGLSDAIQTIGGGSGELTTGFEKANPNFRGGNAFRDVSLQSDKVNAMSDSSLFDGFTSGAGSILSTAANRWIDQEFGVDEPARDTTQFITDSQGRTTVAGQSTNQIVSGVSNMTLGLIGVGALALIGTVFFSMRK